MTSREYWNTVAKQLLTTCQCGFCNRKHQYEILEMQWTPELEKAYKDAQMTATAAQIDAEEMWNILTPDKPKSVESAPIEETRKLGHPIVVKPQAGDRIILDHSRIRLTRNKEFSNGEVEVLDIVEK